MRRMLLSCLLLLALLAGCGGEKPAEMPEETPPAEETEQGPEREETPEEPALPEEPEKEEAEAPGEAEEPARPAGPEEVPEETAEVPEEAEPLSGEALAASAMAAYAEITEELIFHPGCVKWKTPEESISLSSTPEAARNVAGRENLFSDRLPVGAGLGGGQLGRPVERHHRAPGAALRHDRPGRGDHAPAAAPAEMWCCGP